VVFIVWLQLIYATADYAADALKHVASSIFLKFTAPNKRPCSCELSCDCRAASWISSDEAVQQKKNRLQKKKEEETKKHKDDDKSSVKGYPEMIPVYLERYSSCA